MSVEELRIELLAKIKDEKERRLAKEQIFYDMIVNLRERVTELKNGRTN